MKVGDVELQEKNSNMDVTIWTYHHYMDANIGQYFSFIIQPQNKYN